MVRKIDAPHSTCSCRVQVNYVRAIHTPTNKHFVSSTSIWNQENSIFLIRHTGGFTGGGDSKDGSPLGFFFNIYLFLNSSFLKILFRNIYTNNYTFEAKKLKGISTHFVWFLMTSRGKYSKNISNASPSGPFVLQIELHWLFSFKNNFTSSLPWLLLYCLWYIKSVKCV